MNEALFIALKKREEARHYRTLKLSSGGVDFWSNDYLGFSNLNMEPSSQLSSGSTGSRLISGHDKMHEQVESFIAKFHGAESALLFNSGYLANLGLLSSIGVKGSLFVYDSLCHASILDGMRLSFAQRRKFRHNDMADLEKILQTSEFETIYVITESVFSMDGDIAPLNEIAQLCRVYNAGLIVDEAHALGVFGTKGEGLCPHTIEGVDVFARVYTYGKALGFHGAAVLGSESLKHYLINFSRPFIYTTAVSPMDAEMIEKRYQCMMTSEARQQLRYNINYFSLMVSAFNLNEQIQVSQSAIQVLLKGHHALTDISDKLWKMGYLQKAILTPTVNEGEERIRICLHAFNIENDISNLLESIKNLIQE
jgi:8-amino-7-oxononanoate synthase